MGIWRNPRGAAHTQMHPFYKDTPDSWVQNQLVFTERPPDSPGSFNFADDLPGEDRARDWLCAVGQVPDLPGLPVGHSSASLPTPRRASAAPSPCSVPLGPLLHLPSSDLTAVGPPPHFCLRGQPAFSEGPSADADCTSSSSSPAGPRSLTSTITHPEGSLRSPVPSTHVTSSVGSFSYQPDCMVTFPRPLPRKVLQGLLSVLAVLPHL